MLVVFEAFAGLAVERLFAVKQIAGLVPNVAQVIDVEDQRLGLVGCAISAAYGTDKLQGAAVLNGVAYLGVADALFLHELAELELVFVAHLDNNTGVLGEERLYDVSVLTEVVQVDVQAALRIGEAHLQQAGDETTGRDVVTSHDPSFLNELLDGHEGVGKIFGIVDCRNIVAYTVQTLCKGRSAKPLLAEREVDVVERSTVVIDDNGADHLLDVADLATGADNDCSRRYNLLAVRILLTQ